MAITKNKFLPVLTYKEFYGINFKGTNPLECVQDFDLEDVIISLILFANDGERKFNTNIDVNNTLLNRLPVAKAARLNKFISRIEEGRFRLSNPIPIAKAISDIYKILPENQPKRDTDDPDFENALLDLILIYNEQQYPDTCGGKLINTHEQIWHIMLMQDLTGLTSMHYMRTSNIKHLVFIQFLRESLADNFQAVEDNFREITRVQSIYSFVVSMIGMYAAIEKKYKDPSSSIIWFDKADEVCKMLAAFDLVYDQQKHSQAKLDISFYVTHPFFEHSDGKIYLVDHNQFAFALDKGWNYFFFKASQVARYLPNVQSFSDFQSFLGKSYVEEYLVTGLLKKLNRTGFRVIETDNKDLPDAAVILNEKDIFLFEIKSSSLHFNIIADKDTTAFQNFLDTNFASGKKGAKQLFNAIKYLSEDKNNHYNLTTKKEKLNIYPIIIYTEQHLNKHAVNDYVKGKFNAIIKDYSSPFKEIKPLIMMHYDFFVENISLLEQRPSLLRSALNEYISYTRKSAATYLKTGENMDYLKSMVPFDKHIIRFEGIYLLDQRKIFKNISRIFKLKGA